MKDKTQRENGGSGPIVLEFAAIKLRAGHHLDEAERESVARAIDELLQRRRDGQSPEEFVVGMAGMAKAVRPEARAAFLQALGAIQRHVMLAREFIRDPEGPATPEQRAAGAKWLESLP